MLVTVIIPVYNVRPFLAEALESVIHQSYEDLEILLIDDGSTDGSGAICEEYAGKDPRIRLIRQENQGLSAARNAGLERMTGDAVAFLDSDDALHVSFIEEMLSAMHRENAELVVCKSSFHRTTGPLTKKAPYKTEPNAASGLYDRVGALQRLADGKINSSVWNKLYRRELWNDIRFPVGQVYEDRDTLFKVFDLCESVYILNQTLYLYRKRSGSISTTHSQKNTRDRILAHTHFYEYVEAHTPELFTAEQLLICRQRLFRIMIRSYLRFISGQAEDTERSFRRELRAYIAAAGKRFGVRGLRPKMKAAYYLIRFFPRLLGIAYPRYHSVRLSLMKQ